MNAVNYVGRVQFLVGEHEMDNMPQAHSCAAIIKSGFPYSIVDYVTYNQSGDRDLTSVLHHG